MYLMSMWQIAVVLDTDVKDINMTNFIVKILFDKLQDFPALSEYSRTQFQYPN